MGRGFIVFFLLFMFSLCGSVFSKEKAPEIGILKSEEGFLFVSNQKGSHFSFEMKGKDLQPTSSEKPVIFHLDGKIFMLVVVPIKEFAPKATEKNRGDSEILELQRDYESKYNNDLMKTSMTVDSKFFETRNGKKWHSWEFSIPKNVAVDSKARKQIYATMVADSCVAVLVGVVEGESKEAEIRKILSDSMETVKLEPKQIDLKALQRELQQEKK